MMDVAVHPGERSLLIVDDDKSFLQRLARAMETRGFAVTTGKPLCSRKLSNGAPTSLLDAALSEATKSDALALLQLCLLRYCCTPLRKAASPSHDSNMASTTSPFE